MTNIPIIDGLLANIFTKVLCLITVSVLIWFSMSFRKNRFNKLFNTENKKIRIFYSNKYLTIIDNGPPEERRSFYDAKEVELIFIFQRFFDCNPSFISYIVRILLRDLFNKNYKGITIIGGPALFPNQQVPDDLPVLVVGSSVSNYIRYNYVVTGLAKAIFENEKSQVPYSNKKIITNKIQKGDDVLINYDKNEIGGILEKVISPNGRTIIFAAGFNADSSVLICKWLINNWELIVRQIGNNTFVKCLKWELCQDGINVVDPDKPEVFDI